MAIHWFDFVIELVRVLTVKSDVPQGTSGYYICMSLPAEICEFL